MLTSFVECKTIKIRFAHGIDRTPSAGAIGSTCALQAPTRLAYRPEPPSPARTEGLGSFEDGALGGATPAGAWTAASLA